MSDRTSFTRRCAICGKVMENVGATRLYCTPCRKHKDVENHLQRQAYLRSTPSDDEDWKEWMPPAPKPKAKPAAENTINSVCARAIAAGRTYGQQVEFERRQKELRERGEID